ncbi:MAG: VOC family protein [Actinobacteria bacterium]|nr:VOC family protein [Actinomycetota bacterium]
MPIRENPPAGAPCWADLMTSDAARSRGFYTELFGWTAEEAPAGAGGHVSFRSGGSLVAGCVASQSGPGRPDTWSVYLASADAGKTLTAAVASGGTVSVPATPVGGLGIMGYLTDAAGAAVGVWQPGQRQGFGRYGEAGAPSWFELHTRGYQDALAFYRDVFGWDTYVLSDTPEFRYTTLRHGEEWLAGVMDASGFLPEGVPSHWSVYFGVDNTDAALARAVSLGGAVVRDAEDTPYGRLATAADPQGARFKLVSATGAGLAEASAEAPAEN